MARTNYGYEKRQRELAKKKKAEEKRQRRLAKRQEKNPSEDEFEDVEGEEVDDDSDEDGEE